MTRKERYPALFAFGEAPIAPLEKEAERSAGRDERIRSVWPYLVRAVLDFQETLRPRERANFDAEDTLTELWVKLAERDHKFDPDRGRYISFAASVCGNELKRLRDRAKTVRPPGNPSSRMAEYQARVEAGTISPQQTETMADLKRVMGSLASIASACARQMDSGRAGIDIADRTPGPETIAFRREDAIDARRSIVDGLAALSPYEAKLLGEAFGLWGHDALSHARLASDRRRTVATIRQQIGAALAKCNGALAGTAA